jgi:N-acetylneuraminate synthase
MIKPYIIAEIGVNHGGSIELAKKQIKLAKEGGADCVKFQSYKANKIASKNSPSYWDTSKELTKSQFELFKKYDSFEPADYIELARFSKNIGIDFSSTPFDIDCLEWLIPLTPFVKIASADINAFPLLKEVAKYGKPIILSTGASTLEEIRTSYEFLIENNVTDITLLHCVLNYPTDDDKAYLKMISSLKLNFPKAKIGYSDHTLPSSDMNVLFMSWLLGSSVIEKHFTHDKTLPGNDHYHAMDIIDLKKINERIDKARIILGDLDLKMPTPYEKPAIKNARRSIVFSKDITKGSFIKESDITFKRPNHGVSVSNWYQVIGKKLTQDVKEDDIMMNHHIE